MAARCRNERSDNTNEIVMHVAWISEGCCAGRHNRRDQLIRLLEGGFLHVESICSYSRQRTIVKYNLCPFQYTDPSSCRDRTYH